mgnify:CR=1 FL=1
MTKMESIQVVLSNAELLYSEQEIDSALEKIAIQLTTEYKGANPLILCVMTGSLMTTAHLLAKLSFPLEVDYIHVSRYGSEIKGGEAKWLHEPTISLRDRNVILIEDIVDEGVTLQLLRNYCVSKGASSVSCATLVEKLDVEKVGEKADYIGLTVPNRYVFGFGMDYKGFWRNLSSIYAVSDLY